MDSTRTQLLRDILEISNAMLALARENDWERVVVLEAERKLVVQRCFELPSREQDVPEVADAIREILRLNQEVGALGGSWKDRLGAEIHTRNVGRTASAAYLSNAP